MGAIVIGVGIAVAICGVIFAAMGIGGIETTSGSAMLIAGSVGFIGGLLLVALGFVHRALVDVANRLDGIIHFEEEELEQLQSLAPSQRAEREVGHGAGAEEFAQDFPGLTLPEPPPAPRAKPAKSATAQSAPVQSAPVLPAAVPRAPAPTAAAPSVAAPAAPVRAAPAVALDEAAAPPLPPPAVRPAAKPAPRPAVETAPEPEPVLDLGPLTDFTLADEPATPEPEAETSKGGLPSWFRRKREAETREPPREPVMEEEATAAPSDEPVPPFEPLPPPRPASDSARADLARREAEAAKRESETAARRDLPPFLRTGTPTVPPERLVATDRPAADRPAAERPASDRPMFGSFGLDKAEPKVPEPRLSEPRRAPEPAIRDLPPREPSVREDFAPDPGPPPAFLSEADLLGDDEPATEPQVSVLKSGVIGGMAYKLYSDGSIEADLPDGTLRFASLQELRDHVSGVAPRSDV